MGEDSALTRAALHRLALLLYDDQRFGSAEAALTRGAFNSVDASPRELLLLSKTQLFQGKVSLAVDSCDRAVDLCQQDEDSTPDTDALGKALRQLGAIQLLDRQDDDAETSLLRAARLGSTSADQGKGLAALATFNIARGDEQSVEEAVDLLNEACATTKEVDGGENAGMDGKKGEEGRGSGESGGGGSPAAAASANAIGLARASVLCTAAQGELLLGRGTATASERLGEALKIRGKLLPVGHPATAWTLCLLARCHLAAGEAVTAEGLFRAALDGMQGIAEEADGDNAMSQRPMGAVAPAILFASPLHPYSKAAMLRGYSELLLQWEKREAEGEIIERQGHAAESSLVVKPPEGVTLHMLHLDETY
ncbi:unnamed protein product [Scytosiphon promiscuus]